MAAGAVPEPGIVILLLGLSGLAPLARVIEVCRATAENMASMLQDVLNQRQTEIDAINGAIVREGKTMNIPTPVNFTLTSLVEAIQNSYRESV